MTPRGHEQQNREPSSKVLCSSVLAHLSGAAKVGADVAKLLIPMHAVHPFVLMKHRGSFPKCLIPHINK